METTSSSRPTIADVARVAGVSVPTVSRVLTGATPVSEERRNRVLAAIQEIGYHPNGAARALVRGGQPIVAVLTSNTTVHGHIRTIKGIEEAARAAGLVVVITVLESADDADVAATLDLVLAQPLAGVIVLDFDEVGGKALELLHSSTPVAAAGVAHASDVPSVFLDAAAASERATQHLLDLGHPTVHFVGAQPHGATGRISGWRRTLARAGAPIPEPIACDYDPVLGYQAGRELAARPGLSAVLCGNDEIALGVISALFDAGFDVPADVSVVGLDDLPVGQVTRPPLTTVRLDFESLGKRTFELLSGLTGQGQAFPPLAAPELVLRKSTAPPRP